MHASQLRSRISEVKRRLTEYPDSPHVWYVDWAFRYVVIAGHLLEATPTAVIVEVGSNSYGLSMFLPRRVIGVDLSSEEMKVVRPGVLVPVIGSAGALPIRSRCCDYVVCVDTFEHVASTARSEATIEILRILKSGGRAFVAFPSGRGAERCDKQVCDWLKRQNRSDYWLDEHLKNGLPEVNEFLGSVERAATVLDLSVRVRETKTTNVGLQVVYLKLLLAAGHDWRNLLLRALLKAAFPVLRRLNFGPCYRRLFVIEASEA